MLYGGDVLLDGESFQPKPRQAVTIALWIKLSISKGVHSLFDTVGSHSSHKQGQYHFEIVDGRIRWFHRDANAREIFSLESESVVPQNQWTHVAATYDSSLGEVKIFINGDLKTVGVGHGLLSADWGKKAGFGSHGDGRALFGYIDDIYIYTRALERSEIQQYVNSFKEVLMRPGTTPPPRTTRKRTTTVPTTTPTTMSTTKTTVTVTTLSTTLTPTLMDLCQLGKISSSSDLRGGLNAGNFIDRGPVGNILPCMELCCMSKTCDLAYMISGRCYLVECYNQQLCEIVPKGLSALSPTVGLVVRPTRSKFTASCLVLCSDDFSNSRVTRSSSDRFQERRWRSGCSGYSLTRFSKFRSE